MMSERAEGFLNDQLCLRPNAPALTCSTGLHWTYADLDTVASELQDRLTHIAPGDRVMVISENSAAKVAALFAIWRAGGIAVPVNARQSEAELTRIIAHADPSVIWFTTDVSEDAHRHAVRLKAHALQGAFGQIFEARFSEATPEPQTDAAVILYTTGTTGTPKGVVLTHGNVRFGGRTSAHLRSIVPEDVIYGVLPTTHVFGLCSIVVAAIHIGAHVRLKPRFVVSDVFEALRDGITLFSGVPQMHAQLMAHAKAIGLDHLGSDTLRYVSSGAAPLDPTWKREAEAFYGVAVQNGYGMTETTAGICATRHPIGTDDVSVGTALPGVEVRVDEHVPGGGEGLGEVLTRGPNVMPGYFRNEAATRRIFDKGGWLRTGDLGRFDDHGHLHIVGRSKELIIHGGFNVYPPEVEAALNDHPDIVQAAVIGRPCEGDEDVLAFCEVANGSRLTAEMLRAFLEPRLAGYKRPAHIVLTDTLPAAPTGKILKHKLLDVLGHHLPY